MALEDRIKRLERLISPSSENMPIIVLDGCPGSEEVMGSREEIMERLKTCRIITEAEQRLYFPKEESSQPEAESKAE